ncbi:MAG: hypothetical protein N2319_07510 [Candidatus Kapabacteria bacterium]|nr:hypothetical protein [Candidatus Kapabacteria bacterium]
MRKFLFILSLYSIIISGSLFSYERYVLKCFEPLLQKSRDVLIKQVGTIEQTNQNDGDMIKKYLKSVGLREGYPYCAAGQYYCFKKAIEILGCEENRIPIKRSGLAIEIFNHSKKFGERTVYKAQVDDLIIWRKGSTPFGHIERIIMVMEKGWVKTVGFNTSKIIDNKRFEGVFIKKRNIYHRLTGMTIRGLTGFKPNSIIKFQ